MNPVYSIAVTAKLTLNLHDLNNEGGEGNTIQTRTVTVFDEKGNAEVVNAISGDMLKHIQAEYLQKSLKAEGQPLCSMCQVFNANRISGDDEYLKGIEGKNDAIALDLLINTCALDDLEGVLVTAKRNLPRKSVIEFGWLTGIPDYVSTDTHLHTKFVPDSKKVPVGDEESDNGDDDKKNTGQNIYHRPLNSGLYALVFNIDAHRIGYNEVTEQYAIDNDQRLARYQALLKSAVNTFVQLRGAQRSTQLPHLLGMEGVLTYTTCPEPAPIISALNSNYKDETRKIVDAKNSMVNGSTVILNFASLSEFSQHIAELMKNTRPF